MAGHVKPFHRLKHLLQAEREELIVAVIFSGVIGILSLALPVATQAIVNTIALGNLLQPLAVLSGLIFAAACLTALFQALRIWVVERIQRRIFIRIASDTIHRVVRARAEAFDDQHGPELVNRFLDVVTLQKSGAVLLVDGLSVIMQTVAGMILLAVYHPWLLAFDLILLAAIVVVIFPLGIGAVATSIDESKAKYELVAWLQEAARHSATFRSTTSRGYAIDRTDSCVAAYLKHRGLHFRVLLRQIVGSFAVNAMASTALLGVGGWLVIQKQLTLGQLVAAEIVVQLVLSGFSKLGKHLEIYYDLVAALDKLGYLQDLPLEESGAERLPPSERPASVELHDVSFAFSDRDPILTGASLHIPPGRKIGLTGAGGSGKSTLLGLLFGMRQPQHGAIAIDGVDLRRLETSTVRDQVALVRTPEIFDGTISDNVLVGNTGVGPLLLRDSLAATGLLSTVLTLPSGMDSKLATGGRPLSYRQSVRLELTRAIAGRPRLLLIDQAIDLAEEALTEEQTLSALFAPDAPWTMVIASNNPDILEQCDEVYTIMNGRLVKR
jgi:ABC-type bacteriocin/lantibiotic exporter with double-glycine peptidase domain